MNDSIKKLTFSERQGIESLPSQLRLGEISDRFRSAIWFILHEHINADEVYGANYVGWNQIIRMYCVIHLHYPVDEITDSTFFYLKVVKNIIYENPYNEVFDFIEYIASQKKCPDDVIRGISFSFEHARLAYRYDMAENIIFPVASEEEGSAFTSALEKLKEENKIGGHEHLKKAAKLLNSGNFSGSVRESVSSIESVVRTLSGSETSTLSSALKYLENRGHTIHPALKKGFENIYGYTSDESGIRHSLLNGPDNVKERDALFMLGACASFVSYLLSASKEK